MVSRGLGHMKPNCAQVQRPQSVFTYVKPVQTTFTFRRPEEPIQTRSEPTNIRKSSYTSQQRPEHKRSQCGIQFKDPGLKPAVRIQLMSSFQDQHPLISCLVHLPVPQMFRPASRCNQAGPELRGLFATVIVFIKGQI